MDTTAIYRNACATICRRVGVWCIGDAAIRHAAEELADMVDMRSMIMRDPVAVANAATAELDWMVKDGRH